MAPWDRDPPSEQSLTRLLRGMLFLQGTRSLITVVLWCNPFELGLVKKVMTDNDFKHYQVLTWYKSGFNQVSGPACTFLPTTEVAIIAFHGNVSTASQYLTMPIDPLQRHNIIIGPKMGKRALDLLGAEINPCEKPAYLAEWILRKITKPGDTVVVAGFGAGGDLRGALNAGCNVFAIEQDVHQLTSVKRMLPLFQPESNLRMVIKPSLINFGYEWSERLEPYCENFNEGKFDCDGCDKTWPGVGFKCSMCETQRCRVCFPAGTEGCYDCVTIQTSLAREQENQVAEAPAAADLPKEYCPGTPLFLMISGSF